MLVHQPPVVASGAGGSFLVTEDFAKDAFIAWLREEFAAANAIIDSLCGHLAEIHGGDTSEYKSAFEAIEQRRLSWMPILQMQAYRSITDVEQELRNVAEMKKMRRSSAAEEEDEERAREADSSKETDKKAEEEFSTMDDGSVESGEPQSDVTDSGSQEAQTIQRKCYVNICSNHEHCEERHDQIKITKGFMAKELVKGHMVNVVRGLKLYEDVFTEVELSKLNDFVNELRVAGQNGELSGETFVLYNQQTKGNKRELIQFGVPIFRQIAEDSANLPTSNIDAIPPLLQSVISHLVQWRLIPDKKKPNSCIINFFDEGEYSQPFLKPPHLEQPMSTLVLSEATMAFGRTLSADSHGNYKGPLVLPIKEGSLLVMRGNSSDTSRQAMCSSHNKRIMITFFRVRREREEHSQPEAAPMHKAMTLWSHTQYASGLFPANVIPHWGLLQAPMAALGPFCCQPMVHVPPMAQRSSGTGVFLPSNTVGATRRHGKHLPSRAQRGRLLALTSSSLDEGSSS